MHGCVWAAGVDAWISAEAWQRCHEEGALIPDGSQVCVGVDVALVHDTTAVAVAWQRDDGRILIQATVFAADRNAVADHYQQGPSLDLEQIEQHIRQLGERYQIMEIAYDPRFFERSAQLLADEFLVFPLHQSSAPMADAYQAFYAATITEHGHLQIPFPFKSPSGFALGAWLNNQRVQRRKGILPESKIAQLDELGIVWEPYDQDWNRGFKAASAYAEQHGDLLVPPRFVTADGFRLGRWISTRRTEKKSGKLAQQRVGQLDSLGMVWDPSAEKWELAMSAAHRYHAKHGDLRVPSLYVTPDGFRLGKWINHRRQFRKRGKLSPARIAQLDALGMNW